MKILDSTTQVIFKEDVSTLTHGSNKKVTATCPMCLVERVGNYCTFTKVGHTYCKTCRQTINAYGDLIGTKVGRLTITGFTDSYIDNKGGKRAMFAATCECGNETTILGQSVREAIRVGHISSCGCYKIERIKEIGLSNVGENNGMYGKTGEFHPNYDHSLTEEYRAAKKDRTKTVEWQRTRKQVVKVYEQKCALCGSTHRKLEVHHIEAFKNNEELRYNPNNCILLCENCHRFFHMWNGWNKEVPSTKELFLEFVEGLGGQVIERVIT